MTPTLDSIELTVFTNQPGVVKVTIPIPDGSAVTATVSSSTATTIAIPKPQLWTTDSPTLYNFTMAIDDDVATGYFGLRTFTYGLGVLGVLGVLP